MIPLGAARHEPASERESSEHTAAITPSVSVPDGRRTSGHATAACGAYRHSHILKNMRIRSTVEPAWMGVIAGVLPGGLPGSLEGSCTLALPRGDHSPAFGASATRGAGCTLRKAIETLPWAGRVSGIAAE